MFERLTEVKDCLERLSAHHAHPQLVQLQQGLLAALQMAQTDYTLLRQAADWLEHIADLLDPAEKPLRSADQVQKTLFAYLETIQTISDKQPGLQPFFQTLQKTTFNYAPGLFHCYDIPPTCLVPTTLVKVTSAISTDVCRSLRRSNLVARPRLLRKVRSQ